MSSDDPRGIIELGNINIKCLIFKINSNDILEIQSTSITQSEGIHNGVIVNISKATNAIRSCISAAEKKAKSSLKKINVVIEQPEFLCTKFSKHRKINGSKIDKDDIEFLLKEAKKEVSAAKRNAWNAFINEIKLEVASAASLLERIALKSSNGNFITKLKNDLISIVEPIRKDILSTARKALRYIKDENFTEKNELQKFITNSFKDAAYKYSSHLTSETDTAAVNISEITPVYSSENKTVDARIVMRENFDSILKKYPEVLIFGEDAGRIGDVNQGLEGLQEKYGNLRVSDTGIREATIIGQGIGMAMRGLRPIAEIQYLDYLLYALQIMSDDLATLRYRTFGKQKAPLIIRTRGHRLEGIWHSGSPMGGIIHNIRGIHVLVPRNMTKAAGFYNTLLKGDDPALVIECLNGYRLKEQLPTNFGEFTTPIGVVETIKKGKDMTVVSYGSTLRIVEEAARELMQVGIDIEIIDIQSLLPFDLNHDTVKSVAKTNRLLVVDEDVPGGASAYLLQEIIENQDGYQYLDSKPATLTAKAHRPAYGSDGDYFSKPSAEDIFEKVYGMMHEAYPAKFKSLY